MAKEDDVATALTKILRLKIENEALTNATELDKKVRQTPRPRSRSSFRIRPT